VTPPPCERPLSYRARATVERVHDRLRADGGPDARLAIAHLNQLSGSELDVLARRELAMYPRGGS
jgi:hypothetical protein